MKATFLSSNTRAIKKPLVQAKIVEYMQFTKLKN